MRILMKYGLSIVLILFGIGFTYAQPLQPIPYENSGWTYIGWYIDTNTMFPYQEDVYNCYFDGDTSINAKEYHKFYFDGTHYWGGSPYSIGDHVYIGGMRNEDELYYFLSKDSTSEVLIYDFSKSEIGDSVPLGYYDQLDYLVVEDTATLIMEDGSLKKVLYLDFEWYPPPFPYRIYEGMGYITGLIPHTLFSLFPCNGGHNLQSFCYLGNIVYHTTGGLLLPNECGYTVSLEQNSIHTKEFNIYPNPFTTTTAIEYELDGKSKIQITIYNSIGEMVYMTEDRIMPQGTHQFSWSPQHLPAGLYFAVLRREAGVSTVKLVKR